MMRVLSQTHNFSLEWNGWFVVVYATVHSYELDGDTWFHHLHEWESAPNPLGKWPKLRTKWGFPLSEKVQKELVYTWFCTEQHLFSQTLKEQL